MDRRDALKSLAALAGATGMRVTPVTTHEATDASLVILQTDTPISAETAARLKAYWEAACQDTALQQVKTIVLGDGVRVEVVRGRS